MTCIDKLRELHPEWTEEEITKYVDRRCVTSEYIIPRPVYCGAHGWEDSDNIDCVTCWNQEIYENEQHNRYDTNVRLTGEDMRRLDRIVKRVGYSRDKVVAAALLLYEDGLNAIEASRNRVTAMSVSFELKE